MGLKLTNLTENRADGLLDGLPFQLRVNGDRFAVEIGDEAPWRHEEPLHNHVSGARLMARDVRHAVYHSIARYRDAFRASPALA